ncbi:MAG: efflux RND transporter periplasmic adaptor subunit [Fimbriimonadaceae bacterium]|nr:efflux RND transporter periplasmic adaptor subunit [Fimbriimonadaceae bacterium]
MKPLSRSIAIVFAGASLGLAGCGMPPGGMPGMNAANKTTKVEKGELVMQVVETGTLEPEKVVEVKSRVGGILTKLLVDEGDVVSAGQLIGVVDPQETELLVKQTEAQLSGAQASVDRQGIEIAKRKVTIETTLEKAKSRVAQLEAEMKAQPALTTAAIRSAQTQLDLQTKAYEQLVNVTQPNARTTAVNAVTDAENNLKTAQADLNRRKSLVEMGYAAARDVEQAQLQVDLNQTRLREAKERVMRLDNDFRLDREKASQQVKAAQAELDRAKTNAIADRVKKEDYRQALVAVREAEADRRDILSLGAAKRQQEASVRQLQSSLDDSRRQLSYTEIRAPLAGVIGKRYVQAGELVTSLGSFSSGTAVVRIDDRSSMIVKLQVNEIDTARLEVGQPAEIVIDALPDTKFTGKVSKIAPAQVGAASSSTAAATSADPVVKYQVEVRLDNIDPHLKAGMSAKCTMKVVDLKDVLRLPVAYLGQDEKGFFVMIPPADPKDKKAKPTRRDITVGLRTSTHFEIKSGLKEGETVVKPEYKGPKRQGMMGPGNDDEEESGKSDK